MCGAGGWVRDPASAGRQKKYNSKNWRNKRAMLLARQPVCPCGQSATEVDHIIPVADGGGDDAENLQGLCKSCHTRKTSAETRRLRT